jgi:D-glycero-D-manno-heptose 1,7-bisphosphate phosphatase
MRTIFLDRDGVINRNQVRGDYVKSWEEFQFLPGALGAIAKLTKAGYQLLVITYQACVG